MQVLTYIKSLHCQRCQTACHSCLNQATEIIFETHWEGRVIYFTFRLINYCLLVKMDVLFLLFFYLFNYEKYHLCLMYSAVLSYFTYWTHEVKNERRAFPGHHGITQRVCLVIHKGKFTYKKMYDEKNSHSIQMIFGCYFFWFLSTGGSIKVFKNSVW